MEGPSVIPGGSCQAGEWRGTAREALPSCVLILPQRSKTVLEALVPKPLPHLPSPPPPRGPRPPPCPCRTLLTWQRAGSGQQVALNSCHNGRALGCGGSEPRPERQRWHGGGRRQVRVWRVRHGHRQVRWGERGRGEREMVVMPMQVRRRGEVNTDGVG